MTSKFNKITKLSKSLAKALLNDKLPKSLERSDLFDLSDKDYIVDQLTNEESIQKRIELAYTIHKTADWKSLKTKIDLPVRKLYWKYPAVAAAFILISLTFFFYTPKKNIDEPIIATREIVPVLVAGILNVASVSVFLLNPNSNVLTDSIAMIVHGFAIGILITFLGGLMAVDLAPKKAAGAAMGLIGIASYAGAGIQEVMSGIYIEDSGLLVDGLMTYDFSQIRIFWLGAAILSMILAVLVWNAKSKD
jgi:hypothetical protein